jgi:glycosyltransferase involved in cell wall biosynthesis
MRILFLTHYFPPEGNAPASRTYEMCKRWVAAGHHVEVITCAPNHPRGEVYPGYRNRCVQREAIDGIRVTRVWTYLAANVGTSRRIANYLSYMVTATMAAVAAPRTDIVIATSPQFFCGWAGVFTSRLKRAPLLLEIRDIWPESIVAVGAMTNLRLIRFLDGLARKMYNAAAHVMTVGDGYKGRLVEDGVPPKKISVVTNGVDREVFFPRDPDPEIIRRYNLAGKFVVSYVGTIGMAAGLEVVLKAGRMLKDRGRNDIVYLLVGDGAELDSLKAQAASQGLDNVVFTGRLDKSEIPLAIAASDACLVHLKRRDLFRTVLPSKIFEAAAMARPIILGVEGNAAELVDEAGAGICIEPDNADELVATTLRLAEDPQLGRTIGQDGHDYITAHFDRDVLARRYLETIEQVVAASRAGRT